MAQAITTAAEIKALGAITSTNADSLLNVLIPQCVQAMGSFCNRQFTSATHTEYRDGNGGTRIMLANYPVIAVTSVNIDGVDIPQSTGFNSPGFFAAPGSRALLLRGGYRFNAGQCNVVITLSAGYGDDGNVSPWPADLKLALQMFVLTRYNERTTYGISSKALAGESVSLGGGGASGGAAKGDGLTSAARSTLEQYLNTIPESGT